MQKYSLNYMLKTKRIPSRVVNKDLSNRAVSRITATERSGRDSSNESGQARIHQQQSGQWGVGRPKDGDEHGNAFVFADPDKVKEAIEVLAEETSVEEFIDLLAIAGIIGMSDKQKGVLWFNVQSANIIPIVEFSNTGNKSSYTYPSVWRLVTQ